MGNSQSENATHELKIVTGDKKGSFSDLDLSLSFTDTNGRTCKEEMKELRNADSVDAKGADIIPLDLSDLSKIAAIRIARNDANDTYSCFIDRIEITRKNSDDSSETVSPYSFPPPKRRRQGTAESKQQSENVSVFPVHRWIKANTTLNVALYDSCLPQDDPNNKQRKSELRGKRESYKLSEKVDGLPSQVEILPADETFSCLYKFHIYSRGGLDQVDGKIDTLFTPRFSKLEDVKDIYKVGFRIPKGAEKWKCDVAFGHQKLAGCNPVLIELCQTIPKYLAVTSDLVKPHLEGKSLQKALSINRMFIIDLRYLEGIECTGGRKLHGPTCLFYQRDNGDLVPVAIQLMPKPGKDNPVFTPSDPPYTWLAAKMWFNLADSSVHQSLTHLGFTHLLTESVAVVTHRQLSTSHPMFRLLAPHFLYVMAINAFALTDLVEPDGWVDRAMMIGRTGMFNIIKKKWKTWDLKENGNLLKDLKRRGVDTGVLPNYYYRDDAKLLWEAIHKYVSTIVNHFYDSKDKLEKDFELHAWSKELRKEAKFNGMPETISSNEELSEILTIFIFISSVGHAAANFEQYDQYGFPPNYPGVLHGERPKSKKKYSEDDIVQMIPGPKSTANMMEITDVLSHRDTNPLGDFEKQYAFDPASLDALARFKLDLEAISQVIEKKNRTRSPKYEYLNPKDVPNAVSI